MTSSVWQFRATCPHCGGPLEHQAEGIPHRFDTRAVLRCARNGCRKTWLAVVTLSDACELTNYQRDKAKAS